MCFPEQGIEELAERPGEDQVMPGLPPGPGAWPTCIPASTRSWPARTTGTSREPRVTCCPADGEATRYLLEVWPTVGDTGSRDEWAKDRPVTLLTATKDLGLSQAAVLAGLLREAR